MAPMVDRSTAFQVFTAAKVGEMNLLLYVLALENAEIIIYTFVLYIFNANIYKHDQTCLVHTSKCLYNVTT